MREEAGGGAMRIDGGGGGDDGGDDGGQQGDDMRIYTLPSSDRLQSFAVTTTAPELVNARLLPNQSSP
jgi:hypothetical protein